MSVITDKIPVTELLAGLAEEAAELAQAALKCYGCKYLVDHLNQ